MAGLPGWVEEYLFTSTSIAGRIEEAITLVV
jgi:hypothetical protein